MQLQLLLCIRNSNQLHCCYSQKVETYKEVKSHHITVKEKQHGWTNYKNGNYPQLIAGSITGKIVTKKSTSNLLHTPHSEVGDLNNMNDAPHRLRKIPVHPYIEASKGTRVWKDPQTELNFFTDLSEYLGHDRKKTGRHTLMGVGQYTRTM